LTHTIQFCFFNAEEVGLRGSLEYAKYLKSLEVPIAAVICMDTIGYNKDSSNRIFEIHAGHSNAKIRDNCLPLATSIEESAKNLGKLGKAQVYKGLSWGDGQPDQANRDKYDPAIQRSDHWSFQTHEYPAVVVSEDFFINRPTVEPKEDSNPHYHQHTDKFTEIDQSFAADIVSSIALAVKKIAEI
jgi:Zn-dependent M28 family amino/carboxypeptidase